MFKTDPDPESDRPTFSPQTETMPDVSAGNNKQMGPLMTWNQDVLIRNLHFDCKTEF